jgi:hypothetical protein
MGLQDDGGLFACSTTMKRNSELVMIIGGANGPAHVRRADHRHELLRGIQLIFHIARSARDEPVAWHRAGIVAAWATGRASRRSPGLAAGRGAAGHDPHLFFEIQPRVCRSRCRRRDPHLFFEIRLSRAVPNARGLRGVETKIELRYERQHFDLPPWIGLEVTGR